MAACSHLSQVEFLAPSGEIAGCEECLTIGSGWMHLRMCHTCGKIGCCDSSPNRHASQHARDDAHPLMRSVEPGEDWSWCAIDQTMFVLSAP